MAKIIIIALDINTDHKGYAGYKVMPIIDKIKFIKNRIISICNQLKVSNPGDTWIFSWREYGLESTITNTMKKYFKDELLGVSKKYPNLIIIAGTVVTFKTMSVIKSKEILSHYKDLKQTKDLIKHRRKLEDLISDIKVNNKKTITVVRNTCYIFENDVIKRHDKMSPFNETIKHRFAVFKPGGKLGRNVNPFLTIAVHGDAKISIALEICMEHVSGNAIFNEKKFNPEYPLIHFVLSAQTNLMINHFYGEYIVHCDSKNVPIIVKTKEFSESKKIVELYANNLLENNSKLQVIEPTYPFQLRFLNQLNEAIKIAEIGTDLHTMLLKYKADIDINTSIYLSEDTYGIFNKIISELMECFKANPIDDETKVITIYQSHHWLSKLSETLDKEYNDFKFNSIKTKLLAELEKYLNESSNKGPLLDYFYNTELSKRKIVFKFRDLLIKSDRIDNIYKLISNYSMLSNLEEKTHPKKMYLFNKADVGRCLINMKKIIDARTPAFD